MRLGITYTACYSFKGNTNVCPKSIKIINYKL